MKEKGQSLVELLVLFGMLSIVFVASINIFISSREGRIQEGLMLEGVMILEEQSSALKVIKETDFDSLVVGSEYHLEKNNDSWILRPGRNNENGFEYYILVLALKRGGDGAITTSEGSDDASSRKIRFYISWDEPQNTDLTKEMIVTDY